MIAALVFSASAVLAVIFVYRSGMPIFWSLVTTLVIIAFALLAYFMATKSAVSPFGLNRAIGFGFWDQSVPIAVAIVGAVTGVLGSVLFNLSSASFNWLSLVRPLATCPIILIPTLKLVETAGEQTLLTMIVLFALSYQNGFFWEKLLKSGTA
jgi:hypothetical protein